MVIQKGLRWIFSTGWGHSAMSQISWRSQRDPLQFAPQILNWISSSNCESFL